MEGGKDDPSPPFPLLHNVFKQAVTYLEECDDPKREQKVLDYLPPGKMFEVMKFHLPSQGREDAALLGEVENIFKYSVKTAHPRFLNMLYGGAEECGVAGEIITAVCNTSMALYEVSPVFTAMEHTVLGEMRSLIGYDKEKSESMITPGGSIGNMMAVYAAVHHACPNARQRGLWQQQRLVGFTSKGAHYSMEKAFAVTGLGMDGCRSVSVDEEGKMKPGELRRMMQEAVQRGERPFFVCATTCTTVEGSIDPIPAIADICEEFGAWLHVDGAWGGSLCVSPKLRPLLNGCERAHSFLWNPHKLLGVPQQCSTLHMRDKGVLLGCFSSGAPVLFHAVGDGADDEDDLGNAYDTGQKTIQCARRVDVAKLWLAWQKYGTSGFAERVENAFDTAHTFGKMIEGRPGFSLRCPVTTLNVCFWHRPAAIEQLETDESRYQALDTITRKVRVRLVREGRVLVNVHTSFPAFFRIAFTNSRVVMDDLVFVLDEIERIGAKLIEGGLLDRVNWKQQRLETADEKRSCEC